MIVRIAPADHLRWLVERAEIAWTPGLSAIEAVDAQGRIHGMVGFDGVMPNAVSMHIALDNAAALRSLLKPAFRVVFNVYGMGVARAMVRGSNARSLDLVAHAGFKFAYRSVDGWAKGEDLLLFEMRRDECPHLGGA